MTAKLRTLKVPPLALDREYKSIGRAVENRVKKVLASGAYILSGEVSAFQNAFAKWTGAPYAVAVASGTDALYLALVAVGVEPGDEVITTPFTYFATAGAIARSGAKPVFVDIDPATFNMDTKKVEGKITPKTKAILPVHLYGQCAEMETLQALAKKHGLALVEDAAQAHGASYRSRKAGAFGDAGCFSFYPTKNLGAYGDGGLITVRDEPLYQRLLTLRVHGSLPHNKYFHEDWGANSRMDEVQAAILNVKLPYLDEWTRKRQAIAAFYDRELEGERDWLQIPLAAKPCGHVYHQYTVRAERRDALKQFLGERGIITSVYYPYPLHLLPPLKVFGYKPGDFPEAERAAEEVLSLPCFPQMTKKEMTHVVRSIRDFKASS